MTEIVRETLPLAITAAAVVVATAIWAVTRSWSPALPVLLELLLAAGLLRLSADAGWRAIAAAALVVAVRKLVTSALGVAAARAADPAPGRQLS